MHHFLLSLLRLPVPAFADVALDGGDEGVEALVGARMSFGLGLSEFDEFPLVNLGNRQERRGGLGVAVNLHGQLRLLFEDEGHRLFHLFFGHVCPPFRLVVAFL
jgi:hypothetical protein